MKKKTRGMKEIKISSIYSERMNMLVPLIQI